MKRVLALIFTIALVATLSVAAFANPGEFLESPSGRPKARMGSRPTNELDEDVKLILTPYSERDNLDEKLLKNIEEAYNLIANSDSIVDLDPDLGAIATELGVKANEIAVSNLFDIHPDQAINGPFIIDIEDDMLDKFAALLCYYDGKWNIVDGAKIVDGKLQFTTDDFGAFAIAVRTADGVVVDKPEDTTPNTPSDPDNKEEASQTGDYVEYAVYAAIAAAVIIALIVIITKTRKPAEENK